MTESVLFTGAKVCGIETVPTRLTTGGQEMLGPEATFVYNDREKNQGRESLRVNIRYCLQLLSLFVCCVSPSRSLAIRGDWSNSYGSEKLALRNGWSLGSMHGQWSNYRMVSFRDSSFLFSS